MIEHYTVAGGWEAVFHGGREVMGLNVMARTVTHMRHQNSQRGLT